MTRMKLLASVAALGLASTVPGQAEEITGSVWFPETHPLTSHGYLQIVPRIEEESDGTLSLQVYTGEAVLPAAAHLSGLRDGIVDMTYHAGTYTPSDLPEDNVIAILGIGLQNNVVVATAVTDFYMNDPAMQAMFERHGVVFLGGYATPPYILMCNTPVRTLDEISDKRIRMPGAVHSEFADAVGAVSVSVPSTEMFTGLERGQLDCAANAANDLKSRSLWDVADHVTTLDLGSYFAGWLHAMNADSWRSLSDADRRVLLDTIPEGVVASTLEYTRLADEALEEAVDHGVTIHEPEADLTDRLARFNEEEVPEIARREGEERFGLDDVDGMISRFEETIDKWTALYDGVDLEDEDAVLQVLYENLYTDIDESSYGL